MTDERPANEGRVRFVNATETTVDLFVNYHETPAFPDLHPLSLGPVFAAGRPDAPFGTYSFEARSEGRPNDPVLASVSVALAPGEAYHACLHRVGDDYRFAVYAADFSPTGEGRLEVRHLATPSELDWQVTPVDASGATGEAAVGDETAAADDATTAGGVRGGTLRRGEWQQVLDLDAGTYRVEVTVDGETVARRDAVPHVREEQLILFVVGDLGPAAAGGRPLHHLLTDEVGVPAGPGEAPVRTTPASPVAVADENRRVHIDRDTVRATAGVETRAPVSVADPDGVVTGLAVESVSPPGATVSMVTDDAGDDGALAADLVVGPDSAPGSYNVRLLANGESLAERAVEDVLVDVR
jgi:hypothetical protein